MNISLQRKFVHRIGFCVTCVIPADLLSADSLDEQDVSNLRADASHDQLSYIQVLRSLEDGVYLARVAASPDNVQRGYTILLSEELLYYALPWDCRLHYQRTDYILACLRSHAAQVQPLTRTPPTGIGKNPGSAPPEVSFEVPQVQMLEISAVDLQEALGLAAIDTPKDTCRHIKRKSTYRMQQAFLRVAVDSLMAQLYQGQERVYALTLQARCALIARLQRWHRSTHHEIVNAALSFDGQRHHMIWQLTIIVPAVADLAA